jgi:hypothetical protein
MIDEDQPAKVLMLPSSPHRIVAAVDSALHVVFEVLALGTGGRQLYDDFHITRLGWIPLDVVGDSQLILQQLSEYHTPRNERLSYLYPQARRLGDLVGVRRWIHHLRGFNKMADAAANIAMDTQTSSQVHHPNTRVQHAELERHLGSDFAHWQAQHFARLLVQ